MTEFFCAGCCNRHCTCHEPSQPAAGAVAGPDDYTPQPSPTAQAAERVPAVDRDSIRDVFMAHGFTVKEGQTDLKQYVYDAADELLRLARLRASHGQAPVQAGDARQYYYRVDKCRANSSSDPTCICWHEEGVGPLADKPESIKSWRTSPQAAQQAPAVAADDRTAEHAMLWRQHCDKLDALVTYCPTCCQGFIAQKDISRDEVIFECGKTAGREAAKKLTAQQAPAGAKCLPVFGLQWPGDNRVSLSTVFDTEAEALEYLNHRCSTPGVRVVPLGELTAPAAPSTSASGGWMPIETAPKYTEHGVTKHLLLGYAPDETHEDGFVSQGYWMDPEEDAPDNMGHDGGWVDVHFDFFSCGRSFGADAYRRNGTQPTHWQPLPASPTIEGGSK